MITRDMNHRVKFLKKVKKQSSTGDVTTEYAKVGSCWAGIVKTTFKEFKDRSTNHETNLTKASDVKIFKIRYLQDFEIDNTLLISFDEDKAKKYEITGINPDLENFEFILISAKAVE